MTNKQIWHTKAAWIKRLGVLIKLVKLNSQLFCTKWFHTFRFYISIYFYMNIMCWPYISQMALFEHAVCCWSALRCCIVAHLTLTSTVGFFQANYLHTHTHTSTELASKVLFCGYPPWPTDILIYCFPNKGWMNPGHSTWPSCFGSSRHTSGLIGDVCQAGQATGKFGQSAIGEQLVDGGGFSHSSCGDHRHCSQQSAAASTNGA